MCADIVIIDARLTTQGFVHGAGGGENLESKIIKHVFTYACVAQTSILYTKSMILANNSAKHNHAIQEDISIE